MSMAVVGHPKKRKKRSKVVQLYFSFYLADYLSILLHFWLLLFSQLTKELKKHSQKK